jgi:hypothetical protein
MVSTSEGGLTISSLARAWKATPRFLAKDHNRGLPLGLFDDQVTIAQKTEY